MNKKFSNTKPNNTICNKKYKIATFQSIQKEAKKNTPYKKIHQH